uniref:Uncharacterized protein n=1 Tax=Anguilla anguilla TaxID=7936 RepID=A0A0E9XPI9_ANGAN
MHHFQKVNCIYTRQAEISNTKTQLNLTDLLQKLGLNLRSISISRLQHVAKEHGHYAVQHEVSHTNLRTALN